MHVVFISDTHGKHKEISIPEGDLLVHAGDISGRGLKWQVEEFMDWFGKQPHPHKVMIAGNHDFLAEQDPALFLSMVPDNVTYLNDSGCEVNGVKIWGSPISPWFYDWAFNRHRGEAIAKHWALIPENTDILITHGPPRGILDQVVDGEHVGCDDLIKRVQEIKPHIHVFGHIHEASGQKHHDGTHFINASSLNLRYVYANLPIEVDL